MAKENFDSPNFVPITEPDPKYILQVNDLKKYFPIKGGVVSKTVGYVKAVDGVTFNLERGTTMGLVGESGCGKTTVGRTILRLYPDKTAGQVLFEGKEVFDLMQRNSVSTVPRCRSFSRIRSHHCSRECRLVKLSVRQ